MGMTTRKNVKERIDTKTGDIIRTSKETTKIWERIDAKTGKLKTRVVNVEVQSATPKARGAKAKRNEMIERIMKLVQDLEVEYHFGNSIIECLKNYKPRPDVKKRKPKYFIPDEDKILKLYEEKYKENMPLEVLRKEVNVLKEMLHDIDSFELEDYWKTKLIERCRILTNLKKLREANERREERKS